MLSLEILQCLASKVGFDACGVATPCRLDDEAAFMNEWLSKGLHGNMSYLERNRNLRYDPREYIHGAQTIVVCLLTYTHSGHDYHRAIKSRLYELEEELVREGLCTKVDEQNKFCDSAPFLERAWAVRAGLGFIGKNHQLIHPTLGSYVHIGELILTEPVAGNIAPRLSSADYCSHCTRCIDACPGQALGQTEWDATKCVAYVTHKCTVCQQVCPMNKEKTLL